jgi:hypothetical protein
VSHASTVVEHAARGDNLVLLRTLRARAVLMFALHSLL